jgi:hypothetical protein
MWIRTNAVSGSSEPKMMRLNAPCPTSAVFTTRFALSAFHVIWPLGCPMALLTDLEGDRLIPVHRLVLAALQTKDGSGLVEPAKALFHLRDQLIDQIRIAGGQDRRR